jgi:hypothetical protein
MLSSMAMLDSIERAKDGKEEKKEKRPWVSITCERSLRRESICPNISPLNAVQHGHAGQH